MKKAPASTAIVPFMDSNLLARAGEAANHAASKNIFKDYQGRKAKRIHFEDRWLIWPYLLLICMGQGCRLVTFPKIQKLGEALPGDWWKVLRVGSYSPDMPFQASM